MNNNPTIVTSYSRPDLDGTACMFAYAEFLNNSGQTTLPSAAKEPRIEARFLLTKLNLKVPRAPIRINSKVILVDASNPIGISKLIKPENVVEIIDHRLSHEIEVYPNAKSQIELVGAAATLIAEKFFATKIRPSHPSTWLLYGAIISNTLNFKAKVTTDRDMKMAGWLKELGDIPDSLPDEMFDYKSESIFANLEESMREELARKNISGKLVGIVQLEMSGSDKLLKEVPQIISILDKLKTERELERIFLTISDLKKSVNLFVADNPETRKIIETILNVKFDNNLAVRPGLIMRKEIWPILKSYLERK